MNYPFPYAQAMGAGTEPESLVSTQAIVMAVTTLVLVVVAAVSNIPGVFVVAAFTAAVAAAFSVATALRHLSSQPDVG